MLKYFILISLFFTAFSANAQVKLLTLNELNNRVAIGKDTTYVVNFWATWCGPCVDELPSFEQLQAQYKDKPLKVILISLDFKSKLGCTYWFKNLIFSAVILLFLKLFSNSIKVSSDCLNIFESSTYNGGFCCTT